MEPSTAKMFSGKECRRETNVRFGILGTGVVGKMLAARLDAMGHEVMVGTRKRHSPVKRPTSTATLPSAPGSRSIWKCN